MVVEVMDRKTHVVRYECEECNARYATEEEGADCEESHEEEEHAH
jgi:hypothetical protein